MPHALLDGGCALGRSQTLSRQVWQCGRLEPRSELRVYARTCARVWGKVQKSSSLLPCLHVDQGKRRAQVHIDLPCFAEVAGQTRHSAMLSIVFNGECAGHGAVLIVRLHAETTCPCPVRSHVALATSRSTLIYPLGVCHVERRTPTDP